MSMQRRRRRESVVVEWAAREAVSPLEEARPGEKTTRGEESPKVVERKGGRRSGG